MFPLLLCHWAKKREYENIFYLNLFPPVQLTNYITVGEIKAGKQVRDQSAYGNYNARRFLTNDREASTEVI